MQKHQRLPAPTTNTGTSFTILLGAGERRGVRGCGKLSLIQLRSNICTRSVIRRQPLATGRGPGYRTQVAGYHFALVGVVHWIPVVILKYSVNS
jgi:hypothetical protein